MLSSSPQKSAKSARSKRTKQSQKPLTYKELREIERINEVSNLGPGANFEAKPFGSDIKAKVNFGSKYKFVPKEGPAPGQYDADKGIKLTKPKEYEAFISDSEYRKEGVLLDGSKPAVEAGNDPGNYDGHLTAFGSGLNKVDMGRPYKFVPKEGPGPGQYSGSTS